MTIATRKLTDSIGAEVTDVDLNRMANRHAWSVGDRVIWDNRGVLHRASAYDSTLPRDMHRTTMCGDERSQ